jgi:hypothetical protein
MFKLFFLFLFIFLNGCSDRSVLQSKTVDRTPKCDTTINYDLENISSERAEAQVCYTNHKINRAYVVIYGASGRVETSYLFNISSVEAIERNYKYGKPLSEITSDHDVKLSDSSTYILSLDDGKIILGKSSNQPTEIYKEFLKTVALTIK